MPNAFEHWKLTAQVYATREGLPNDLWEGDPYDLEEFAFSQFSKAVKPEEFIDDAFADDLASKQHDEDMRREAHEAAIAGLEPDMPEQPTDEELDVEDDNGN